MRKRARAVSQRLFVWDSVDQGEMKGLTLRSLFVLRLDQKDYRRVKRKVLE